MVEDQARLAPTRETPEWLAQIAELEAHELSPLHRAAVASGWLEIARMEHASIAAFARFSLQLLQLAAPPSLIEQTTSAIADETRHARLAFAIASRFAGRALGPGPLAMDGSLAAVTLLDVLRLVFREGCVGETTAALEAHEAGQLARGSVLRTALSAIAEDETRHAQLAWQFVTWALAVDPRGARATLEHELSCALDDVRSRLVDDPQPEQLERHGLISRTRREQLRRTVLRDVVAPCVNRLLRGDAVDKGSGLIRAS